MSTVCYPQHYPYIGGVQVCVWMCCVWMCVTSASDTANHNLVRVERSPLLSTPAAIHFAEAVAPVCCLLVFVLFRRLILCFSGVRLVVGTLHNLNARLYLLPRSHGTLLNDMSGAILLAVSYSIGLANKKMCSLTPLAGSPPQNTKTRVRH